jgi:plastocyanin
MTSSRWVVGAGALSAVAVLLGAGGCQRESPRFDKATSAVPPITASVAADGSQTLTLQMNDVLRFVPSNIQVHPGKITVTLANAGKDPHQFEVPDLDVSTGNIPGNTTKTVTFTIPAGAKTYPFDCAYHTSEHMVGTLTVVGF